MADTMGTKEASEKWGYLDLTDEDISKQYHRASPLSGF